MYYYHAFNLRLSSAIELPFLPVAASGGDVSLRLMPSDGHAGPPPHMAWSYHVTPRLATLAYADLGTLAVVGGHEIQATLRPSADETLLPLYIISAALAVLLYQRGLIVLQASAVALNGKAAVFMSERGGGKSTIAAVLCGRGHRLLADDITAIDMRRGYPEVIPAFPVVQIEPETSAALEVDPHRLRQIHPRERKHALEMVEGFCDVPRPLRAIYQLRTGADNSVCSIPLQAGLAALMRSSYPNCLLQPGGLDHLQQCSRLIGEVTVYHLLRRYVLADVAEQAHIVEGHLTPQSLLAVGKGARSRE